jgi:hypothetical protein
MPAVDTLKLARKYESAGFQPKQAQDMAAATAEAIAESGGNLATKDDLQGVELRIEAKIADVKGELRAEIQSTKYDIAKWMIGQTLAIIGTFAAIIFAVGKSGLPAH